VGSGVHLLSQTLGDILPDVTRGEQRKDTPSESQRSPLRIGDYPHVRAVVLRVSLELRHLEEMMQERGVGVDHSTINR